MMPPEPKFITPLNSSESDWDAIEVPNPVERERMEYIDKLLQKIRRYDGGTMELPSAVAIGRHFGVGPWTIRRLVTKMQDQYGIPIDFDHSRKGYYYLEDVAFSPFVQFSEAELVSLYLAQHVGAFENTPFKARLQSVFRKVLGIYGKKLSFDPSLLDSSFSFDAAGPHARIKPAHLDACARAMLRREELILTYVKQHGEGAGVPERRHVRPLHITYRDFAFYVLCKDLNRTKPRLFMVTRMQEVEETKVKFQPPRRFNARKHLEKAFKVFTSDEAEVVSLDFSPTAAARVVERRWHSSQKFTQLPNGGVRMSMKVGLAPDLYSWIGGFFGDCRVAGPETLRAKMRELHLAAIGEE